MNIAVDELEDIFHERPAPDTTTKDNNDSHNNNNTLTLNKSSSLSSEDLLRRVSFAKKQLSSQLTAVAADYLYKKQAKPKVRRRVNFECIDKVIHQVGDVYSLKLTLKHVKHYLDANDLLFPKKVYRCMYVHVYIITIIIAISIVTVIITIVIITIITVTVTITITI